MSNLFYKYLSEKIIKFFLLNKPRPGDKFFVQFEKDVQVKTLYNELRQNTISQAFSYVDNNLSQKYDTYELQFGNVQLLVAASMKDGPHPDFLATLRNLVGIAPGYQSKAILFIHCSSLDSILGGAGSLSKEGMPLNIESIKKGINRKIAETGFGETDKQLLNYYLENKSKELDGAPASIFEYVDIIEILGDSQITAEEYRKFELFADPKLGEYSGKKLKVRLDENHQNYVRVSEIHNYGLEESRLERFYGEEGAKRLKKGDWQEVAYPEIEKYILSKKTKTSIEYFPIIKESNIWDKEEGQTKSKERIRNIIVFSDTLEEELKLQLSFSEFTKNNNIKIQKGYENALSCTSSGKKLQLVLKNVQDPASFYHLKYSDAGCRFEFKIAVLRCSDYIFDNIKTQYLIEMGKRPEESSIRINTDNDEVIFNPSGEDERHVNIHDSGQIVIINEGERTVISIGEDYAESEETDDVHFEICIDNFAVMITKAYVPEKRVVIDGMKLWYLKQIKKQNFDLQGDNNIAFGTKPYFASGEFRKTLLIEREFIKRGLPCLIETSQGAFCEQAIILPTKVRSAFDSIISYYQTHDKIPSLTYINTDLKALYQNYLCSVQESINNIIDGDYLNEEQKGIFYLGVIKRTYGDGEILVSPLHPINIAYQLMIEEMNISGLEDDENDLMRKFQQSSLLPYINIDPYTKEKRSFVPIEQIHSPEWKVYVDEELPRYKGSKDFVSKLVSEKIREFIEHFSYLFSKESNAPVRINLINTGDCKEIVQGILKYYVKELNNFRQIIPMRVTMYSQNRMDNAFELMSKMNEVASIVDTLDISFRIDDKSIEDLIDIYRENVQFYFKDVSDGLEYAHITFMELEDDNQSINTNMNDIPSGIVMNGLSAGVPSALLGDSYRTGFGTKYIDVSSDLVDIAVKYNALNAAMHGASYRKGSCEAFKISPSKQQLLDRVYDASNWVTFISPKVDLSYFKSDPSAKDLLIIHYSDQYNLTSSGYDAITVTKKSKQYQEAISRYLTQNGVEESKTHSYQIINMFNALNGDWLLRMLSYKNHFPLEKLSILSAMKLAVKRYSVAGLIWVPISLEEILRVSGSVGLSQNEAVFSAKNLGFEGITSDDLLMVGIRKTDKVQVTFYPIEVKISNKEKSYLEKGVQQALKTRNIFDEIIGLGSCVDKDIKTRLYRNFFMQQVLVNAGKMLLYEIGDAQQGWEQVIDSELRGYLSSENYEVVESMIPEMGKAGVISFSDDCKTEKEFRYEDVLIVEKTKKEGINLLAKRFDEIETVKWSAITDVDSIEKENLTADSYGDRGEEETAETHEPAIFATQPQTEINQNESAADFIESSKNEKRVLIGKDKYLHDIYWEFGSKNLANRHVLITGTSGEGKTYSIQTMLYELAKENISAVIFDYTEGFMLQQLEQPFTEALGDKINQQIVYSTGVPINPFKRHEIDLGGVKILEKESDVAARLADIFEHVYDFGAQQTSAIFEAAFNGLHKYGNNMNMRYFQQELEAITETNKTAKSVISKMTPFFRTVEFTEDLNFDWGSILYAEESKINIIQLTIFSREMQVIITEMMLWDAWYYTKKYGSKDKPFVVVLDEAQKLSHSTKSPSAVILTEGRKFGWSAWFATQSLKVLKDDEVVRLMQAAFKMFFKPTNDEMVKTSKQIDATDYNSWLPAVQNLKKGQCIVVGDRMKANGKVGPSTPVIVNISSFESRKSEYVI